jgi:hypothetical protein
MPLHPSSQLQVIARKTGGSEDIKRGGGRRQDERECETDRANAVTAVKRHAKHILHYKLSISVDHLWH